MIARKSLPFLAPTAIGTLHSPQPSSHRAIRAARLATAGMLGVGAIVTAGCGGATPPPAPAAAASAPLVVARGPSDAPDLSPVPEPEHLFAIVRWSNPAKSAATVGQWIGMPLSPVALLEILDAGRYADLVAEDEPVDVAVTLDPKGPANGREPLVAVSMGAKSLDRAKQAAGAKEPLTQVSPGVFRLSTEDNCLLAASSSKTGARIVCGGAEKDAEELLPYMTRTLPGQQFGPSDIHAELRLLPLQKAYGATAQQALRLWSVMAAGKQEISEPTFDRALRRAATALAEEGAKLMNDADLATLDFDVGAEAAELTLRAKMRGRESWIAGTMLSLEKNQSNAPDLFWQLSRDAGAAAFVRPAEPQRVTEIIMVLGQLVDGWLHHEGVSTADRASATALFDPTRVVSAPAVWASGNTQGVSWYVAAIDEAGKTLTQLRSLETAFNRPKIRGLLDKELLTPLGVEKLALRMTPPPAGLPAGALDLEVTVALPNHDAPTASAPKSRAKAGKAPESTKSTAHVLAFADKGRTWVAIGSDRKGLAKVLMSAKDAKPVEGDAKAKPELARLHTEKLALGGYLTLAGLLNGGPVGDVLKQRAGAGELLHLFEGAPNQGKTPITYTVGVSSQGPLTLTSSVRIPKGAIEDAIIAIAGRKRH